MIAAILLLSATLAHADVPNRFDSTKMSTESLALGVNTCTDRFEESLKKPENDGAAKRAGLITRHYCSCMMDATQSLAEGKKLSKELAKKCLNHAKLLVDGYLRGKSTEKESNLFDSKTPPTASVYTMFLVCLKKHATDHKDSARLLRLFS